MIESAIKTTVRDVADFPHLGIVFKDITPILKDPILCTEITKALADQLTGIHIDVVAGVESRGFLFGMLLSQALQVPFVPIRKAGKLPSKTIQQKYELEYGNSTLELHQDAVLPGQKVLVHDDLLATGGTVIAASKLILQLNAEIAAFSFIIGLDFLHGEERLKPFSSNIFKLASYL
jgi:adenine phosphoribosyltransferase